MKVTCEIKDYSNPAKPQIKIHNAWNIGEHVELEINGERYEVDGAELISAINRCMLNYFGK